MSSDYTIRLYKPGDETEIASLLADVWTEWPHFDLSCTSLEHWKWKYLHGYDFLNIAIAEHNGKIVGVMSNVPTKIKIGEKILQCNQATDLAIHPDHRKKICINY